MIVECPTCAAQVHEPVPDALGAVKCPGCGGLFSLPEPEAEEMYEKASDDDRLSADRVHFLSDRRRALAKTRMYLILAAGFLLIGSAVLAMEGARRLGSPVLRVSLLVAAVVFAVGGLALIPKTKQMVAELERSDVGVPTAPPDFTGLGDGSQRWRDLEEIR